MIWLVLYKRKQTVKLSKTTDKTKRPVVTCFLLGLVLGSFWVRILCCSVTSSFRFVTSSFRSVTSSTDAMTSQLPSTCIESLALLNSFLVTVVTPDREGKGMLEGYWEFEVGGILVGRTLGAALWMLGRTLGAALWIVGRTLAAALWIAGRTLGAALWRLGRMLGILGATLCMLGRTLGAALCRLARATVGGTAVGLEDMFCRVCGMKAEMWPGKGTFAAAGVAEVTWC